jgi:hypothetical protein
MDARLRVGVPLLLACGVAAALVAAIAAGALPPVSGLFAVVLVVTTVFWHLREHLPSLLFVFFMVLLVMVVAGHRWPKLREAVAADDADNLARAWAASGSFNGDLPVVIHLVFDELMSPGAITEALPGGPEVRHATQDLAERHALRMYDSVYSRHFFTGDSLNHLMNGEYVGRTRLADLASFPLQPSSNATFDDLAARGYRTVVFQTAHVDFCQNPHVDMCETFASFDPSGDKNTARLRNRVPALWQALLQAYELSYVSEFGQTLLSRKYGLDGRKVDVLGIGNRYDVQRFPEWFDRFAAFAAGVPRGTHLFAHFMVPHSPYLLTEGCAVAGRPEAGYYLTRYPPAERSERRQHFYKAYLGQVRCVVSKLDALLSAVELSPQLRDALIVIHGDHGSRISNGNVLEDYRERDFVDNYATFFAVRAPGVSEGIDCRFTSLPQIFRRHMARAGARSGDEAPLPVIVGSRAAGNGNVEAAMPSFGCHGAPPSQ